jgi:hypothetical protein
MTIMTMLPSSSAISPRTDGGGQRSCSDRRCCCPRGSTWGSVVAAIAGAGDVGVCSPDGACCAVGCARCSRAASVARRSARLRCRSRRPAVKARQRRGESASRRSQRTGEMLSSTSASGPQKLAGIGAIAHSQTRRAVGHCVVAITAIAAGHVRRPNATHIVVKRSPSLAISARATPSKRPQSVGTMRAALCVIATEAHATPRSSASASHACATTRRSVDLLVQERVQAREPFEHLPPLRPGVLVHRDRALEQALDVERSDTHRAPSIRRGPLRRPNDSVPTLKAMSIMISPRPPCPLNPLPNCNQAERCSVAYRFIEVPGTPHAALRCRTKPLCCDMVTRALLSL